MALLAMIAGNVLASMAASAIGDAFSSSKGASNPDVTKSYEKLNKKLDEGFQEFSKDAPSSGISPLDEKLSSISSSFSVNKDNLGNAIEDSIKESLSTNYEIYDELSNKVDTLSNKLNILNENLRAVNLGVKTYGSAGIEATAQFGNPSGGFLSGITGSITKVAGFMAGILGLGALATKKLSSAVWKWIGPKTSADTAIPESDDINDLKTGFEEAKEATQEEVDEAQKALDLYEERNEIFEEETGSTFKNADITIANGVSVQTPGQEVPENLKQAYSFMLNPSVTDEEKEFLKANDYTPTDDKSQNFFMLLKILENIPDTDKTEHFIDLMDYLKKLESDTSEETGEQSKEMLDYILDTLSTNFSSENRNQSEDALQTRLNEAEAVKREAEEESRNFEELMYLYGVGKLQEIASQSGLLTEEGMLSDDFKDYDETWIRGNKTSDGLEDFFESWEEYNKLKNKENLTEKEKGRLGELSKIFENPENEMMRNFENFRTNFLSQFDLTNGTDITSLQRFGFLNEDGSTGDLFNFANYFRENYDSMGGIFGTPEGELMKNTYNRLINPDYANGMYVIDSQGNIITDQNELIKFVLNPEDYLSRGYKYEISGSEGLDEFSREMGQKLNLDPNSFQLNQEEKLDLLEELINQVLEDNKLTLTSEQMSEFADTLVRYDTYSRSDILYYLGTIYNKIPSTVVVGSNLVDTSTD